MNSNELNLRQVCVSPDYVLVPRENQDDLIDAFLKVANEFWPEGSIKSPDLGNLISMAHRQRLLNLLSQTRGKVVLGGDIEGDIRLALTIVKDVSVDEILEQE
jgi:aldehyde dehydrogenase (NAD+)